MKITFRDRITGMVATTHSSMPLYYWSEKWGNTDQGRASFFPDDSGIWHRVVSRPNAGTTCVEDIFVINIEDSELCTWCSIYHEFKRDFPDHPMTRDKAQMIYAMNEGAF